MWLNSTTTDNWKVVRGYGEWHVCKFPVVETGTVQTVKDALIVYNFKTQEFAETCLRHMKAFDWILHEFEYRDTYLTSSSINTAGVRTTQFSDWKCELFGVGSTLVIQPSKDKVPNWFWRKMQYLIFGNNWIKQK